jgi:hypothetical protein
MIRSFGRPIVPDRCRPAVRTDLSDPVLDPAVGTVPGHLLPGEFASDGFGVEPADRIRVDEVNRQLRRDVRVVVNAAGFELDREDAPVLVVADRVNVAARDRERRDLVDVIAHRGLLRGG